jgi:hypothetical protein
MKSTDTLGHATLADSLNAACYAITCAYIQATKSLFGVTIPGEPGSGILDEYIPGEVFDFAVNAGWIPRPDEPEVDHGIPLGCYYVEDQYREWFIGLLEPSLSKLRESLEKTDAYDDEEAQKLKTELWEIILLRVGNFLVKRLKLHEQPGTEVRPEPPQTPPEAKTTAMPEWGEAFKKAQVPETSAAERIALEENFLATHKHPVYEDAYEKQELCLMANVHRKQWERWRRAEIANNSQPGKRILDLLERNAPARSPQKLPRRKREKLRV